jgi:hypothetical protein
MRKMLFFVTKNISSSLRMRMCDLAFEKVRVIFEGMRLAENELDGINNQE